MSKHLLLVGGGHTHVLVLKALKTQSLPSDLKITLVSPHQFTPYSGMLPGLIAGHYTFEDIHIDLEKLAIETNIQFIKARAIGLDPDKQQLELSNAQTLNYDVLSFDTGATPDLSVPGASDFCIPVKPIDDFYSQWASLFEEHPSKQEKTKSIPSTPDAKRSPISIVGSGAAGVELALAMHYRINATQPSKTDIQIISRNARVLSGYPARLQHLIEKTLHQHSIQIISEFDVAEVTADSLTAKDGRKIHSPTTFWCTQVKGAEWLTLTGLPLSEQGFIEVSPTLQSYAYENIFATGDVCHFTASPLPKAGVYAVRMTDTLSHNLLAFLNKQPLECYQPQSDFLSLLACGDKTAVGCKFGITVQGRWVWKLKNWIDRRFMNQFR